MRSHSQFLDDGTGPAVYVPPERARVVILPVPLEKTVSYLSGTASAPERIIKASRQVELFDPELNISPYEVGIHTCPPVDCAADIAGCLEAVRRIVLTSVSKNRIPVCLGGEHTLTLSSVRAVKERFPDLSVLHLDAHADLRDSYGGTGFSHACVMRRVLELGLPVVSAGVRSLSKEESLFMADGGLSVYPEWKYGKTGYPWEEVVADLSGRVYISVDMDVFDPSEVPGVGTPEPGGLSWRQVLTLFGVLRASEKTVVGFDLVELCPQRGSVVSEFFAARLLYKMIGYFCRVMDGPGGRRAVPRGSG